MKIKQKMHVSENKNPEIHENKYSHMIYNNYTRIAQNEHSFEHTENIKHFDLW